MDTKGLKAIWRNFALADELLTSVIGEAKNSCSGLVDDQNADPLVIPSLAKGLVDGGWFDL